MREHRGRARATIVLSAPLALLTVASMAGNLLAPHLLAANPLLLVALAPRTVYLTVAAGHVPLGTFLAVGLVRLAAADPSHYLLGRLHGPRLAEMAALRPGPRRAVGLVVRAWERFGLPLVALSPTGKVLVLAGASRIPHRRVAVAALAGTLVQLLVLYAGGRAVAGPSQGMAAAASDHSAVVWLVVGVVTAGVLGRAAWRARRRVAPPRRALTSAVGSAPG